MRLKHHIWSLSRYSIGVWECRSGSSCHHVLIITHIRIKVLLELIKVGLSSLRSTIIITISSCPTILWLLNWRIIICVLTVMLLLRSPWMSISRLVLRDILSGNCVILHQILDHLLLFFLLFANDSPSIVFILSSDLNLMMMLLVLEFLSLCYHLVILLEHFNNLVLFGSLWDFGSWFGHNYHSLTVFIYYRAHKSPFLFIRYILGGKWGRGDCYQRLICVYKMLLIFIETLIVVVSSSDVKPWFFMMLVIDLELILLEIAISDLHTKWPLILIIIFSIYILKLYNFYHYLIARFLNGGHPCHSEY